MLYRRTIRDLAPVTSLGVETRYDVRVFTGTSGVDDVLGAIYTYYRWLAPTERPALIVHGDPTLSDLDVSRIRLLFPEAQVVLYDVGGRTTREYLRQAGWPALAAFRDSHVFGPKLLDMSVCAGGRRYVYFDGDVLFHARPVELVAELTRASMTSRYNEDVGTEYAWNEEVIHEATGIAMLPSVNAGLVAVEGLTRTFHLLERILTLPLIEGQRWYAEQTLCALALSAVGARPLPPAYDVCARHARQDRDVITQHYCSHQRSFLHERWLADVAQRRAWPVRSVTRHVGSW